MLPRHAPGSEETYTTYNTPQATVLGTLEVKIVDESQQNNTIMERLKDVVCETLGDGADACVVGVEEAHEQSNNSSAASSSFSSLMSSSNRGSSLGRQRQGTEQGLMRERDRTGGGTDQSVTAVGRNRAAVGAEKVDARLDAIGHQLEQKISLLEELVSSKDILESGWAVVPNGKKFAAEDDGTAVGIDFSASEEGDVVGMLGSGGGAVVPGGDGVVPGGDVVVPGGDVVLPVSSIVGMLGEDAGDRRVAGQHDGVVSSSSSEEGEVAPPRRFMNDDGTSDVPSSFMNLRGAASEPEDVGVASDMASDMALALSAEGNAPPSLDDVERDQEAEERLKQYGADWDYDSVEKGSSGASSTAAAPSTDGGGGAVTPGDIAAMGEVHPYTVVRRNNFVHSAFYRVIF